MNIAPWMIVLLAMASVFALSMALRQVLQRQEMSAAGVAAARATPNDIRSLQLRQPFAERVIRPMLRQLYGMGRYFTPSKSVQDLQQNLIIAGLPGGLTVTDFLGLRALAGASLAALVFTMMVVRSSPGQALLAAGGGFAIGLYMPNMWLKNKVQARKKAISRALPDLLDMMSICVDAGLGFEAAIQKVAFQSDNELALEMRRVISEIRVGVSRADALRHLVERTQVSDVASFVAVLVQADRLGIAIRNVLTTQSVQMRVQRRQRAEEDANKAPIKMLIPLAFFIFPAVFAVILGPAVPRIMAAF